MNNNYINPFISASKSILEETTGLIPETGEIYIKNTKLLGEKMLVMIGLTGTISGNVVFVFDINIACKIASAMMMGMPVEEMDEIAKSAICELCNMILGKAVTELSKTLTIDITPPTILVGENLEFTPHKGTVACVPLIFGNEGKFEIDISYIEK